MKTTEEKREYQRLYRLRHKDKLKEAASQDSFKRRAKAYLQAYESSPNRIAYRKSVREAANAKQLIYIRKRRAEAKAKKLEEAAT